MKKIVLLFLLLVPFSVSSTERPRSDSPAWKGYCECMNDEQIYFAKHF
jgi:hypothetical protein